MANYKTLDAWNIAEMVKIISEEDFNLSIPPLEKTLRILNGFINSYEGRTDLK